MRRWLGVGHLHGGSDGARAGPGWLAGRPWRLKRLADGPWQPRTARKQATAAQMAPTGRSWQLRRRSRAAVSRSCTFFLQTAISKRRGHADLPGKPGPGNRMNVQRRPSCTFILSPDAPQGEKTLEPRHRPHQDPRMNVQHDPTPPAGTTTSHRRPPPTPTRPTRQLNPEANTLRPDPYRTTQPTGTPTRRPTLIAHLRPHPHNQTPYPDHATGGHLMRPGRRRPSRQGRPARPPRGTFCAQGNRLRRKQPEFVTFCAKRHPVHKTSSHTALTRATRSPDPRKQTLPRPHQEG